MFQQHFAAHLGESKFWPLLALGLFIAVFAMQAYRIFRAPKAFVDQQARMPLEDELTAQSSRSSPRTRGPPEERPSADRSGSSPRTRGPPEERPSADRSGSRRPGS